MEKMRPDDTLVSQSPAERPSDAESWARIESIDPEVVALRLAELLSGENIQRARQSELNRYTSDIRMTATVKDIKATEGLISEAEQNESDILSQVRNGTGIFAELDMKILAFKARGKDTSDLERERQALVKKLAPLEKEYERVAKKQDWLNGSNAMLQRLAVMQAEYVEQEKPKWDVTDEYKQALGELALLLDRIDKLPRHIPEPVAPPDMASQNPTDSLPLSIDGQIEEERQIFTFEIQSQIKKIQETIATEIDTEPKILSYQELANMIPARQISLPKQRHKILEIIQEDAKV